MIRFGIIGTNKISDEFIISAKDVAGFNLQQYTQEVKTQEENLLKNMGLALFILH